MPSAKKRAAKAAPKQEDDKGEGYMALENQNADSEQENDAPVQQKKTPQKKAATVDSQSDGGSRVMYIGNLPHGFYEKQLLGFFSQFGKITKVRLSRSKKSAKAKHYAFLEFQFPEVCRIAAEAMNGYFMFKQKITCSVMQPDKIHPMLFKGANKKFKDIPWRKIERKRHDKERTPEEEARRISKLIKRDKLRQERIKKAGIEYEYDGVAKALPIKPKKIKIL